MAGRPRKLLAGHSENSCLTKEQQEEKKQQEELIKTGAERLDKPPDWLRDTVAKKEWKTLLEEFKKLGIIGNLDYNNLGAYCNAFSSFIEITKKLKGQPFVVVHTNKLGAKNLVQNPFIATQLKYSEEMRKFASLLGLTIDSRLKIAGVKLEKEKNKIESEFGEI